MWGCALTEIIIDQKKIDATKLLYSSCFSQHSSLSRMVYHELVNCPLCMWDQHVIDGLVHVSTDQTHAALLGPMCK